LSVACDFVWFDRKTIGDYRQGAAMRPLRFTTFDAGYRLCGNRFKVTLPQSFQLP
jgi:hypothetical protein